MPSCAGEPEFADALEDELRDTIDTSPDTYDLSDALNRNECLAPTEQEWWILKPSLLDGGEGIKLFSTWKALIAIFHEYGPLANTTRFTAQKYVHPPLFLPGETRKWHIRAYAIAARMLDVYVFDEMLVLLAPEEYTAPWDCQAPAAHLTNSSQLEEHLALRVLA